MRQDLGTHFLIVMTLCHVGIGQEGRAHAFSDPVRYSETTDTGGSAGRHFTGSPLDGYGCNACHQGGSAIPVSVSGLPTDGYEPGATYEVSIRLDSASPSVEPHAALVLEFADEQRRPAGVITPPEVPPDATQFPIDELCVEDGVATGFALKQLANDAGRNLIAVPECGARAVRFFWTAPTSSVGTVWMAGGVVHSDEQASPAGDGVTLLRRPLPAVVGQAYSRELASGCSLGGAAMHSPMPRHAGAAGLVLGIVGALRRKQHRIRNVEQEARP
jgi:hypothetical protein